MYSSNDLSQILTKVFEIEAKQWANNFLDYWIIFIYDLADRYKYIVWVID
jgi:hypothetical protein